MKKIAIIGGGACGLMAASRINNALVTIFEQTNKLGKKLLATGNGRCNFSNSNQNLECFFSNNKRKVRDIISEYTDKVICDYFNSQGILITCKDGYYYPLSNQAQTILGAFLTSISEKNTKIVYQKVVDVIKLDRGYNIVTENGERQYFDYVVLSTGGLSHKELGSLGFGYDWLHKKGYKVNTLYPGLVKLKTRAKLPKYLNGCRQNAKVTLSVDSENIYSMSGEVLFGENSLSGIVIMQLSNYLTIDYTKHKVVIKIDLIPDIDAKKLSEIIVNKAKNYKNATNEEILNGLSNRNLIYDILIRNKINAENKNTFEDEKEALKIAKAFKSYDFEIIDNFGYDNSQVTLGGLDLDEIDDFLMLKNSNGLFAGGEILDVAGTCGGYNLQWAFACGMIIGDRINAFITDKTEY